MDKTKTKCYVLVYGWSAYSQPLHWRAGYCAPIIRLILPKKENASLASGWSKPKFRVHYFTSAIANFHSVALKDNTYTVWTGCLVVAGRGVCTLTALTAFSGALLRCWLFWKMLIPGCTRLKLPPSRMYTCSGVTSSQREPWKPERHTQVCGLLQEPRFWQGGWQSAEERAQMDIKFSAGHVGTCTPPLYKAAVAEMVFPDLQTAAQVKLIESRGH